MPYLSALAVAATDKAPAPGTPLWMWGAFLAFIAIMLAIDLGLLNRKAHAIKFREAITWVCVWVSLALLFMAYVWHRSGQNKAMEFLTGYLIEQSLSVDNLFVFLLLFKFFRVDAKYQHRVLFYGILGAIFMRAILIIAGSALVQRVDAVIYIFGLFLVYTGIKMALEKDKEFHPEDNPVLKLFRKYFPVAPDYHEDRFFVRHAGKLVATPLFVVLLLVESTDLVFAVDSIPAIFAVTNDPFILFTSNIFAILGLRSMFFALSGVMTMFHYLAYGLSVVLVFVGAKMLLHSVFPIPTPVSLAVVAGVLAVAVGLSIIFPKAPDVVHLEATDENQG